MARASRFGLRNGVAAGFAVAAVAAGATSQAGARSLAAPGSSPCRMRWSPGTAGATATGYIADPTDDTDTETTGTQNTALTGPGSTPIDVAAPISGPYGLPGYSWISSTSSVTGSVNVSVLPNPSISATANILVPSAYGAQGNVQVSAEINYNFEIVDTSNPSARLPVPITVSASGGFTYANTFPAYEEFSAAAAQSSFGVSGVFHDYVTGNAGEDPGGTLVPKSWSDNQTYLMDTGEQYTVTLSVGFNGSVQGNEGGGGATISAYVDPTFALGAGADPSQYSLVFSAGIGNAPVTSGVPEPSTWAMMLIGFAGLGFGARKRIAAASVA